MAQTAGLFGEKLVEGGVDANESELAPGERLFIPHRKRLSHAYVTREGGARELSIYYGTKEVTFDEERLFAFGEQLVQQSCFTAESATAWGPGYPWAEVGPLLEALVDAGILKRGGGEAGDATHAPGGVVASLVPAATCTGPRGWSAGECEAITRELGGRAVEIGYLESFVPVYRIAHPALDADDRQVGEANVYPAGLRLDRATEWRVCQYAGSRFRDDAPMNVTALKAMIKHWKPMMATLVAIRAEVRKRLGLAGTAWTVGDLHTFASVVLAVPAFSLMRAGGASPQPPLHPVLSSLFRITDGIRLTTHEMLFLSEERTRSPEEAMTAGELYAFAERNGIFFTETGVCAGPKSLIDEFLVTAFDGTTASSRPALPDEVEETLATLHAAVDYAFLGLQVWAVTRAAWLPMSRAYRALREILAEHGADAAEEGPLAALRVHLQADWDMMQVGRIAIDSEREVHLDVCRDTYEQAWRGLTAPIGPPTLAACIAPLPASTALLEAADALRRVLLAGTAGMVRDHAAFVEKVVAVLTLYLREEQAILAAATGLEREIDRRLARPSPTRSLSMRDIRLYYSMRRGQIATWPYIFDTFEEVFGAHVDSTAEAVHVSSISGVPDASRASHPGARAPHEVTTQPPEQRAT